MVEKKRYKNAEARAKGYTVICPYKGCGVANKDVQVGIQKGDVIECINCRKGIKIRRVV